MTDPHDLIKGLKITVSRLRPEAQAAASVTLRSEPKRISHQSSLVILV